MAGDQESSKDKCFAVMGETTFRESPYTLPPSGYRWSLFHMRKDLPDLHREIIHDFEGLRRDFRRIRDDSQIESFSGHALHKVRGYSTCREHRLQLSWPYSIRCS